MRPKRPEPLAHEPRVDAQLRAVADPTRRAILSRLVNTTEVPAGDLADGFRMTRPAVSRHLRVLLEADLVAVRTVAQSRLYSANPTKIQELRDWFDNYWDAALPRLKSVIEKTHNKDES